MEWKENWQEIKLITENLIGLPGSICCGQNKSECTNEIGFSRKQARGARKTADYDKEWQDRRSDQISHRYVLRGGTARTRVRGDVVRGSSSRMQVKQLRVPWISRASQRRQQTPDDVSTNRKAVLRFDSVQRCKILCSIYRENIK